MAVIKRTALKFDEAFTQVPNAWARDGRVSRRARGLMLEVMSHSSGWKITTRSLVTEHEGRDAVRTALQELIDAGYIVRSQSNAGGRFGEVEYVLSDPHENAAVGLADHGSTAVGSTAVGSSAPIRRQEEEKTIDKNPSIVSPFDPGRFEEFWSIYPRKAGKGAAARAFEKAAGIAGSADVLVDGARRFAADPNLPEKQFIPHPSTWLSQRRWEDEPLPVRSPQGRPSPLDIGRAVDEELRGRDGRGELSA